MKLISSRVDLRWVWGRCRLWRCTKGWCCDREGIVLGRLRGSVRGGVGRTGCGVRGSGGEVWRLDSQPHTRAPQLAASPRSNDRRPRPVSYYSSKFISWARSPIWKRSRAVFWTGDWQCRVRSDPPSDVLSPADVSILASLPVPGADWPRGMLPHRGFKINSCSWNLYRW